MKISGLKSIGDLETLSWKTARGLFVAADGSTQFWIIRSEQGNYAVQLIANADRRAFEYFELREAPSIQGVWLGEVKLQLGSPVDRAFKGRCGLVIRSGFRLYLKVWPGIRLIIDDYDLQECQRWSTMFPEWRLVMENSTGSRCVFRSPFEPPRIDRRKAWIL